MPSTSILDENLETLRIDKYLAAKLKEHAVTDVTYPMDENEMPYLTYRGQHVYSTNNPLGRVDREMETALDDPNQDLVVLFGFGLGFHAERLAKKYNCTLMVFDPSLDLLKAGLMYRKQPIENIRIVDNYYDLSAGIEHITYLSDRRIISCLVPTYTALFPKEFERFNHVLRNAVDTMRIRDNTLAAKGQLWSQFAAQNLPTIAAQKSVEHLKDRFTGVPGVVVGAGPSLDKNISLLKEAKGEMLICAVNSALKPLAAAGVAPDFAAIIEANNLTDNFADIPFLEDLTLVLTPDSNPHHFGLPVKQKLIAGQLGDPTGDWLNEAYEQTLLPNGGSVACTSLALLHFFGCDPIILLGMDSAFTDYQSHASSSVQRDITVKYDEEKGTLEQYQKGVEAPIATWAVHKVPAWGGQGEVLTYDGFNAYRGWFETAATTWAAETRLINATEGGARHHEFEEMTFADAIQSFKGDKRNLAEQLDQMVTDIEAYDPRPLHSVMNRHISIIGSVGKLSKRAVATAKRARAQINKGKLKAASKIISELQVHEKKLGAESKKSRLLNQYIGPQISKLKMERQEDLSNDPVVQTLNSLNRSITVFNILSNGADTLTKMFEPHLANLAKLPLPGSEASVSEESRPD